MDMSTMVAAVKKHALANYNTDGWDFIVEAFTDEEIAEVLLEPLDGVPATTEVEAIKAAGDVAKLHDERRREVQSTAW